MLVLLALCTPVSALAVPTQGYDQLFAAGELPLASLAGRKALVTGASSGIGKATACALASCGTDLILVSRREGRLAELKAEIGRRSPQLSVHVVAGDVREEALYDELRAQGHLDAVDICIANAGAALGTARVGEAGAGDLADWSSMLGANCYGAFRTVSACLPGMLERQRGHVITLGSIAGLESYEGGSVYCASKAALHAFTKSLRYETYNSGVRTTLVAPGFCGEGTEFSEVRFKGDGERAAAVYEGLAELTATDVARQIVWALRQPAHVNLDLVHVMPSAQGSAQRIHRQPIKSSE